MTNQATIANTTLQKLTNLTEADYNTLEILRRQFSFMTDLTGHTRDKTVDVSLHDLNEIFAHAKHSIDSVFFEVFTSM